MRLPDDKRRKVSRQKVPGATLDYKMDWSEWLGTDTLAASAWASSATGVFIEEDTFSDTAGLLIISGGSQGTSYELTNTIETASGGLIESRSFILEVI